MCGVCGFVISHGSSKSVSIESLQRMNRTMINRGPDGEGYYYKNGKIGLGSRRLKIIDLSESARMPMTNETNTIQVVFNGEIYNFQSIRDVLIKEGHIFKSKGDTEVIVHAYEKWGINCFNKFNGMFAIAIWDETKEMLILGRDRVGIKPLFYYYKGDCFAFASELKPIMDFPQFKKEINLESLFTYISLQNIPAPLSIFNDVFKLEPGKYLEYSKGEINIETYWDLKESCNPATSNQKPEVYAKEIENLLIDSVKQMLVCDVPYGLFLSGGIDSTLIASIMSRISDTKLKSFTIGFDNPKVNEAPYAKKIAKYLGLEHNELYLSQEDLTGLFPFVSQYFDEPFGDISLLPTLLLSKFARKDITVALSGDGGDEFFAGYSRFSRLGNMYSASNKYTLMAVSLLSKFGRKMLRGKIKKISEVFADNKLDHSYSYLMGHISENQISKMSMNKYSKYGKEIAKFEKGEMDMNTYVYYLLAKLYLPSTVLQKTDRASMAFSLEARVPFLDHRLIEYSGTIPFGIKRYRGQDKYLLRKILKSYVPESLTNRPKKGFDAPMDWSHGDAKDMLFHYLDFNKIKNEGYLEPNEVKKIIDQHLSGKINNGSLLWILLSFELWLEKYI